jgi:hypothetical protein
VSGGQETRESCVDLRSLRLCLIQSKSNRKKTNAPILAIGAAIITVIAGFGRGNEGKLEARDHRYSHCLLSS